MRFNCYTEFNFNELYAWNCDNTVKVSILHGNLVVVRPDYVTEKPCVSFLGTNKIEETIRELIDYSIRIGGDAALINVPLEIADCISSDAFEITPDDHHHDYILDAMRHTKMDGSDYSSMRAKIRVFEREYEGRITSRILDLDKKEDHLSFYELFDRWVHATCRSEADAEHERRAITRALEAYKELQLRVVGVFVDNVLAGTTVHAYVDHLYEIGLFLKADYSFKRIYDYLVYQTAQACIASGRRFINIEHDLGIPGLRIAKQQLKASHMFPKVRIELCRNLVSQN